MLVNFGLTCEVFLLEATKVPSVLDCYCFFSCVVIQHIGQLVRFSPVHLSALGRTRQRSCGVQTASLFSESDSTGMRLVTDPYSGVCLSSKGLLWGWISVCETGRLTCF